MKNLIKATFLIHGMNCKSCAVDIMRAFKKANGVIHCELRYKEGKINIEFDSRIVKFKDLNKVLEPQGYYLGHNRKDDFQIKKSEAVKSSER